MSAPFGESDNMREPFTHPEKRYVVPIVHVKGKTNASWTRYGVYSHKTGNTYTCLTLPKKLEHQIKLHYDMYGNFYDNGKVVRTEQGHMRRIAFTYKIFIMELTIEELVELRRHFRETHVQDKKTDMGMIYIKLAQKLAACRKN